MHAQKLAVSLSLSLTILLTYGIDATATIELNDPEHMLGEDFQGTPIHLFRVTYLNNECPLPVAFFDPPWLPSIFEHDDMHVRKAVDSDDDVHIVWMRLVTVLTVDVWQIYYSELSADGTIKVAPKLISDESSYDAYYPALALDSADNAHVVWTMKRFTHSFHNEIYYSKIEDETGADLTGVDAILSDEQSTDSGRVVAPGPDDWDNPRYIEHPDIAVDSQDNVHVVWSDRRDAQWEVYYQKQDSTATPNILINDWRISLDDLQASQCPAIDVGKGDDVHIAWQDERDGAWEIYYQRQSSTGAIEVDDKLVSERNANDAGEFDSTMPDVDAEAGGGPNDDYVHIVFMDRRNQDPGHPDAVHIDGKWEIYLTTLRNNATADHSAGPKRQSDLYNSSTVYGVYTGLQNGDDHSMYPQIAAEDSHWGKTNFSWHDLRDNDWEIYYSHVSSSCNNPNTDTRVTAHAQSDLYPSIALDNIDEDRGRDADIKWQSDRSGNWEIYNAKKQEGEWIQIEISLADGDSATFDMFPDPFDDDATDGIEYMVGMPLDAPPTEFTIDAQDCLGRLATTGPQIVVAVEESIAPGVGLRVLTNYPNPFSPQTTIGYRLPRDGHVALQIYDVRGRQVVSLANVWQSAGPHVVSWKGEDDGGRRVPSGVYVVRLAFEGQILSRQIVLTR